MKHKHLWAAGATLVIGLGSGFLAARLPVRAIGQSVAAAFASWVLGCLTGVALRLIEPARQAGVTAIRLGIAEGALGCVFVIGTGVALHLVLGWAASTLHPAFASWRPLLIGLIGAVGGALAYSGGDTPGPPTE